LLKLAIGPAPLKCIDANGFNEKEWLLKFGSAVKVERSVARWHIFKPKTPIREKFWRDLE
jgi:hypothetical protein